MAYYRAVCRFFAWCEQHQLGELMAIEPLHVAAYIEAMQRACAKPAVKQHLAAIRMLFDWLVTEGILLSSLSPLRFSAMQSRMRQGLWLDIARRSGTATRIHSTPGCAPQAVKERSFPGRSSISGSDTSGPGRPPVFSTIPPQETRIAGRSR